MMVGEGMAFIFGMIDSNPCCGPSHKKKQQNFPVVPERERGPGRRVVAVLSMDAGGRGQLN